MNGKQLKNSILQWAIQGKLVPQDPNDEPASVLLEKIRQEKERLIKEKKIKRDKNASIIFRGEDNSYYEKVLATGEVKCIDDEIPFELPKGWEWCRLNNLYNFIDYRGATPTKLSEGIPLITAKNVKQGYIDYTIKDFISSEEFSNRQSRGISRKGDILYTTEAPLGNVALADLDEFSAGQRLITLQAYAQCCTINEMFVQFMLSPLFKELVSSNKTGTTVSGIKASKLKEILIPLPPLSEQRRIVAKLQELEPLIEQYGKSEEALCKLNATIAEKLKKSILQEAIQGRLVPQIESEGTAAELLQQIKQEKQRLVKEGKLKKSALTDSVIFRGDDNKYYEQIGKNLIDVTDEIPFELPKSWSWIRGKHAFLPMESIKPENDFIYIDVDAVNNKLNIIDKPKMILAGNAPSRATRKLHQNDILFSMVRPYLKNVALVPEEFEEAVASTGFYVITPSVGYHPQFLLHLMLSNYVVDGLNSFMKGDNSPSINNCHIENYLFPLPPVAEQQRIVAQIEKLFEQLQSFRYFSATGRIVRP